MAEDGSVKIKVSLEAQGVSKGLSDIKSRLGEVERDAAKAGKGMDSSMQQAEKGTGRLRSALDALKAKMSGVSKDTQSGFDKMTSAAKKLVGAVAAIGATKAVVDFGKQAVDSYAKYEQMVGGIDKLFGTGPANNVKEYAAQVGKSTKEVRAEYEKLSNASNLVQKNAQNAFKTAGMSANTYMESVTGFSAALINSLGGDTEKAARMADVAMRGISDNANTFGTDSEMIVATYQSLARGQYAMLDNLKLGYGGTKAELARLVDDANKYAATHKDAAKEIGVSNKLSADSYADVVAAIELVQQKQGISGTTAREAATTIEGSVNSAKAAWENFVTELGKDDADMDARTTELVDSVVTAASNIVPRVGTIMESLGTAVVEELPHIGEMVSEAMDSVDLEGGLEKLLTGGGDLLSAIQEQVQGTDFSQVANDVLTGVGDAFGSVDWGSALSTAATDLTTAITQTISGAATYIEQNGTQILAGVGSVVLQVGSAIVAAIPGLLTAVGSVLNAVIDSVLSLLGDLAAQALTAAGEAAKGIEQGFYEGLANLGESVSSQVQAAVDSALALGSAMLDAGKNLADNIGNGISGAKDFVVNAAQSAVNGAKDAVLGLVGQFQEVGGNIIDGIKNGITGAASRIADAAKQAATDALNAAKSFLGIHSPSRKFRDEVGVQISRGMAKGIEKGTGKVVKQAKKTSNLTVDAFSKQLRKLEKRYGKTSELTAAFWKSAGDRAKAGSKVQEQCYAKMEKAAQKYADALTLGKQKDYYASHIKGLKEVVSLNKKAYKAAEKNVAALKKEYEAQKSGTKEKKAAKAAYDAANKSLKEQEKRLEAQKDRLDDAKQALKDVKQQIKETAAQAKEDLLGVADTTTKSLADIKSDLKQTVEDLTQSYKDAVESTKETITGSLGFFKEFTSEGTGSVDTLIGNLRSQAEAAAEYSEVIGQLQDKLGDTAPDFLKYLTDAGIDSLADLKAVNSATAEELQTMVDLYAKRQREAENAAAKVNKDVYDQTVEAIKKAQSDAEAEAKKSYEAYQKTMEDLGKKVSSAVKRQYKAELAAIKELGTGALEGEGSISDVAARYAETIDNSILEGTERYAQYTTSAMEAAAKATEDSVEKQTETVKTGTTLITETLQASLDTQYSAIDGTMGAAESRVAAAVASIRSMMASIASLEASAKSQESAASSRLASARQAASQRTSPVAAHAASVAEAAQAVSVNWYAAGGVFDKPQVIGIGERGTEYALRESHLDGIAERMGRSQRADFEEAIGKLARALPRIIRESTPDSISVNKREFGRLVREV